MRRIARIWILALAAAAAACSPHEFPVSEEGGDPGRDFSLSLRFADDLPVLAQITGTKAGGAPLSRYTVQLYRYRNEVAFGLEPDYSFTFTRRELSDLDTTLYLPVSAERYRVLGWVDFVEEGSAGYDASDFSRITVAESYPAGSRARDAFCTRVDADLSDLKTAGQIWHQDVVLRRPVAQIRFIAPEALTFLGRLGVDAASLRATLRYTAPLSAAYDLFQRVPVGELAAPVLTAVPEMDTSGELVFCSDFVLATDVQGSVSVDFSLADASGKVLCSYAGDLPVKAGHATTVTFGTSGGGGGGTPGGIGIDPGFDDEIEVPIGLD